MTKITTLDLSPFYRASIGVDRLFDRIVNQIDTTASTNYPPYNIVKTGDNTFEIQVAVAGFTQGELDVNFHDGQLTVSGEKKNLPNLQQHRFWVDGENRFVRLRVSAKGLRIIEVDKEHLSDLAQIMALVAGRKERYILFCDDLSFEDGDDAYKALKTALDGGLARRAENMLVYATSNRRHLMPEKHSENREGWVSDGEIHPGEADFLLGALDVALVLVHLDLVVLLRIRERGQGGLILNLLLDDLLLQFRGVQFHQGLAKTTLQTQMVSVMEAYRWRSG